MIIKWFVSKRLLHAIFVRVNIRSGLLVSTVESVRILLIFADNGMAWAVVICVFLIDICGELLQEYTIYRDHMKCSISYSCDFYFR